MATNELQDAASPTPGQILRGLLSRLLPECQDYEIESLENMVVREKNARGITGNNTGSGAEWLPPDNQPDNYQATSAPPDNNQASRARPSTPTVPPGLDMLVGDYPRLPEGQAQQRLPGMEEGDTFGFGLRQFTPNVDLQKVRCTKQYFVNGATFFYVFKCVHCERRIQSPNDNGGYCMPWVISKGWDKPQSKNWTHSRRRACKPSW